MRLFYSADYVASVTDFDTTRKAEWVADSLEETPIAGVQIVAPEPLTAEQVAAVHDPAYVDVVRTGLPEAAANFLLPFPWDAALWPMVAASNGGAVAAAVAATKDGVAGSLSSGMHHARRERGIGFCTFNGLVLGARAALANGASSVLILDLDAHCGGGTASLIADDPRIWQVDVSVSGYDNYVQSGRIRLDVVRHAGEYLPTIQRRLEELDASGVRFDLCIYNAGMDPYEGCSIGGLSGVTQAMLSTREDMVFDWCLRRELPAAFVLAGGYTSLKMDIAELVELHRSTVLSAIGER